MLQRLADSEKCLIYTLLLFQADKNNNFFFAYINKKPAQDECNTSKTTKKYRQCYHPKKNNFWHQGKSEQAAISNDIS